MARKVLFQTALTATNSSDVDGVGNLREDASGNVYRYIKNVDASALLAGGAAFYREADVSAGILFQTVGRPTAGELNMDMMAGVSMAALTSSVASSHFGWVQVQGVHSAVCIISASAYAPGIEMIGLAGSASFDDGALSATSAIHGHYVRSLNSASTGSTVASVPGYINCL